MKTTLKNNSYTISSDTLQKVLEALSHHWFSENGEYNNDEVIEAEQLLQAEIQAQEVAPH